MMRGSSLARSLEDHTQEYTRKLNAAERHLTDAITEEARLKSNLASALGKLASIHLSNPDRLDAGVVQQLEMRDDEYRAMQGSLKRVEGQIQQLLGQREEQEIGMSDAEARAEAVLHADADYLKLMDEQKALKEDFDESNLESLWEECNAKLAQFDDRAYKYLKDAEFGSENYRAGRMTRYFDGILAKACNFQVNFQNELMLHAMRDEIKRRIEGLGDRRKALEEKAHEAERIAYTQAGWVKMKADLEATNEQIIVRKKEASDIQERMVAFTQKKDGRYLKVMEMLKTSLGTKSLPELRLLALATPEKEDDELVDKIASLGEQLDRHQNVLKQAHEEVAERKREQARSKEVEKVLNKRTYTSSDYRYDSDMDIGSLLAGYMLGNMTASDIESEVKSHRHEVERESYSSSSSSSGSSFGSSWGSSSSSSDSFSSSSSFGGGSSDSFSTSDSF